MTKIITMSLKKLSFSFTFAFLRQPRILIKNICQLADGHFPRVSSFHELNAKAAAGSADDVNKVDSVASAKFLNKQYKTRDGECKSFH